MKFPISSDPITRNEAMDLDVIFNLRHHGCGRSHSHDTSMIHPSNPLTKNILKNSGLFYSFFKLINIAIHQKIEDLYLKKKSIF